MEGYLYYKCMSGVTDGQSLNGGALNGRVLYMCIYNACDTNVLLLFISEYTVNSLMFVGIYV